MKFSAFLRKNIKWNLSRDYFSDLCCTPTSEDTLVAQLYRLSNRYFPAKKQIETAYTQFCLNEIALSRAKTPAQKHIKQLFGEYWHNYLRVKNTFDKPTALFPADGDTTRLEQIAKLLTQCTQYATTKQSLERICNKIQNIFDLEEKELRNLENVITLYKINYYCALARGIFRNIKLSEIRLAKMLDNCKIVGDFIKNDTLRQSIFCTDRLVTNLNCLAASASKFFRPTHIEVKHFFFCNGKNVFDTFCYSKLGNHTAEFYSPSGTLQVSMQYFLQGTCEIRRYKLKNTGKVAKKITADFLFRHTSRESKTEYFPTDGTLCLSVEGESDFYCALAIVENNHIYPCDFEEGRLSRLLEISPNQTARFDLVTVFAENMPSLSNALQSLNNFGETACPFCDDRLTQNIIDTDMPLRPSAHGYLPREAPKKNSVTFNFTYQLGNEDGATFLDNAGNCTTLLEGFVFGISGEKVYSVKNGRMTQLNCREFSLGTETAEYRNTPETLCKIIHDHGKTYRIEYKTKQRTLFFFPLEEKSRITKTVDKFQICDKLRRYTISCKGEIESFTGNILECNTERLRYKLSGDIDSGTCLAVCFAPSTLCEVEIKNERKVPTPCPIVRESLISTYLNYMNNKNVFCIANFLKRIDSLSLAAICYTNPKFVKFFAKNLFESHRFFYDVAGQKTPYFDRLALPLAIVYYATLIKDGDFPTEEHKKYAESILFKETFSGKELCVKALALKKAARLEGFDKVKCLIEYNNLKKTITNDAKLYGYAQAIGAVGLCQPGKERLKDLCNRYDLPKSWYYVSQLENLYGLALIDGTLQFSPKVSQANVLEQLALNVNGKRIETIFTKSTVQSMTLNGVQYFLPLKTDSIKNTDNKLEVRY